MTEKTTRYQDSTIFYRATGKGKMLLFIHGFAEDGNVWAGQQDFLKEHFRLIIPDLPGSGRSELIPGANIETYAEVMKLIIDTEHGQSLPAVVVDLVGDNDYGAQESYRNENFVAPVILIGHSLGGYITLAFAEKYPGYLHSFCLFHSTAFADNDQKKQSRQKGIDFMKDKGTYPFLKTAIPGLFTKSFAEKHPEKIEELIEKGRNFSCEALVQYYTAMIERPDRTAVLKNFPHSILFIIGEHDQAVPLQNSLKQCYYPLRSHVHFLHQSAHMGMWEEKERANNILLDFIVNNF